MLSAGFAPARRRRTWASCAELVSQAAPPGTASPTSLRLDEAMYGDQVINRELGKTMVDAHGLWPRLPYADAAVTRWVEAVPPSARFR